MRIRATVTSTSPAHSCFHWASNVQQIATESKVPSTCRELFSPSFFEYISLSRHADAPEMTGAEANINDLGTLLMGEEDISDKANMTNVVKPITNSTGQAPVSDSAVFVQGNQPTVMTGTPWY